VFCEAGLVKIVTIRMSEQMQLADATVLFVEYG
jgi:hypothetical protein